MKPPRDDKKRALQHGKILEIVEHCVFLWLNQRLLNYSRGGYTVFRAMGSSMSPTYDLKDSNLYGVTAHIAPSELRRGMFWREFRDRSEKTRIVTDPKEVKAPERDEAKLEFAIDRKHEEIITKQLIEKQGGTTEIFQQAAAIEEKAVQFLHEVGVRCAQVRGTKAKGKATTSGGKQGVSTPPIQALEGTVLEQWRAHGASMQVPAKETWCCSRYQALSAKMIDGSY
ncbi:hypothetical protein PG994_006082 [Apiospora phragmitis]|uniref:Uncharacterized protein n=1 Tax=Apiospora phragmitis TaxID=2905665 RepID=A0ABR1VE20_9PEZI